VFDIGGVGTIWQIRVRVKFAIPPLVHNGQSLFTNQKLELPHFSLPKYWGNSDNLSSYPLRFLLPQVPKSSQAAKAFRLALYGWER
jgi:hypothetical protein